VAQDGGARGLSVGAARIGRVRRLGKDRLRRAMLGNPASPGLTISAEKDHTGPWAIAKRLVQTATAQQVWPRSSRSPIRPRADRTKWSPQSESVHMREMGVRELKQSLSETLRAVGRGEQVRVTLRGRPLADIVPAVTGGRRQPPARARCRGPSRRAGTSATKTVAETGQGPRLCLFTGAFRAGRQALKLYLDPSALVKRYVPEPHSELVRDAMREADWYIRRVGFVETIRAVGLVARDACSPANGRRRANLCRARRDSDFGRRLSHRAGHG
jgi:prevent-host-death family protein